MRKYARLEPTLWKKNNTLNVWWSRTVETRNVYYFSVNIIVTYFSRLTKHIRETEQWKRYTIAWSAHVQTNSRTIQVCTYLHDYHENGSSIISKLSWQIIAKSQESQCLAAQCLVCIKDPSEIVTHDRARGERGRWSNTRQLKMKNIFKHNIRVHSVSE